MTNNVNVSLDTSVTPNVLKVQDHGHIHIDKKPGAQTITWNLTGVLAQGSFVPMDDPDPGFEWVSTLLPDDPVFGKPVRGSNGNSMSITDTHTDSSSNGRWMYKLRVLYGGTVYSTQSSTGIDDAIRDPTIINR